MDGLLFCHVNRLPRRSCNVVGRSFFAPGLGGKNEIGNGVECWKGFYQSLRPTQMGMSLIMGNLLWLICASKFHALVSYFLPMS